MLCLQKCPLSLFFFFIFLKRGRRRPDTIIETRFHPKGTSAYIPELEILIVESSPSSSFSSMITPSAVTVTESW